MAGCKVKFIHDWMTLSKSLNAVAKVLLSLALAAFANANNG